MQGEKMGLWRCERKIEGVMLKDRKNTVLSGDGEDL